MYKSWLVFFLTPIISYAAYPAFEGEWGIEGHDEVEELYAELEIAEADEDAYFFEGQVEAIAPRIERKQRVEVVPQQKPRERRRLNTLSQKEERAPEARKNPHRAPERKEARVATKEPRVQPRTRAPERREARVAAKEPRVQPRTPRTRREPNRRSEISQNQGRPRVTQRQQQPKERLAVSQSENQLLQRREAAPKIQRRSLSVKKRPSLKSQRPKSHHAGKRPVVES